MKDILRLTVPLTVWLASFSAVYGLHGLVCSDRWPETGSSPWGRAALVAVWLTAVALQVAFLAVLRSRRFGSASVFVRGVSLTLAVVAVVATVWTLMPVVTTTACLPPA